MVTFAQLTTFHTGGSIKGFAEIQSVPELTDWLSAVETESVLPLGNGSNLLAADHPLDWQVLRFRANRIAVREDREQRDAGRSLWAEAGANLDDLVEVGIEVGYGELANLSGIPGTVGGAIVQNAGAFGVQFGDFVDRVEVLDYDDKRSASSPSKLKLDPATHSLTGSESSKSRPRIISFADLQLGYRDSYFKQNRSLVILSVWLKPSPSSDLATVNYRFLADFLSVPMGQKLPAWSVREAVLAQRKARNGLYDPQDPSTFSAGSFFKNPFDRGRKLSAGDLIESAGIRPGFGLNDRVHLASNNPLIIVNDGNGNTQDILTLAEHISNQVFRTHQVRLQPEVQLIDADFGRS